MSLFRRRKEDLEANDTARQVNDKPQTLDYRPSPRQWFQTVWPDLLTMAVLGTLALVIWHLKPAAHRLFPVYFENGEVVYPQYAYPLRKEIIPTWLSAVLSLVVPITIFLVMQARIRSFWDFNNATTGLLYAVLTGAVFQVFVKYLIGGLRPHFYDVCKPVVPTSGGNYGRGLKMLFYDRSVCSGTDTRAIDDAMMSFPSGHSTAAFAGFVFLSLYLNAKLKLLSNHHPAYWKLVAVALPLLGATLIAGALTIDKFHNWYDLVAGALLGTLMAFMAYRMVYAAVWDFRFNHVPLVRDAPFPCKLRQGRTDGFGDNVFTRKAGWGAPDRASEEGVMVPAAV
ncbi:hypothetical protein H2201_008583 [Coniosporium apollinis]|uniref:Phosphatidic acid phosphatase type 2/haloperoxidase domain-containing protein n=2 Tax=Coniosporium TaxID=2810619 RepID=A0ABQ9NKY5_9PEZI|nr:hypothetical protein H2199_006988 [Cladosporium sp. JES 115]KAJ9656303.1 hypothetical protein H2201_008583 [Coniosporium apollinis]